MAFLSVTRLRIRSVRFLPAFLYRSGQSIRQAGQADGNLGVDVLRDAKGVFWTRTAWTDEAAMRAYMMAGPHKAVMPSLMKWCDEASVVHWTTTSNELPSWAEAYERMIAEGRPSRLKQETPGHRSMEFPPPVER